MKPFLAVLWREIAERKLLFVGAAFASLFPIVLPWLPGLSSQKPADLRGGMALGLALITSVLLALVLGTTVIGRDLSERRIGFYFARPVPGWAIWAGKMLGAALLSMGAGALILLSAFLAGGAIDPTGIWGPVNAPGRTGGLSSLTAVSFAVVGVLLLLVLSHAVSVMVRSRSPWRALDLAAFGLVMTILWTWDRLLWQEGALEVRAWGRLGLAAVSLLAVALAGLVQVMGGRTDLRRGHRLLSLTLWTLVGAATLGHATYIRWALRVTPEDLVSIQGVWSAPAGRWISVTGHVRGRGTYVPMFLLDAGSERFVKLPGLGPPYWWNPPIFSLDGSHAFWFEPIGEGSWQLLTMDLRRPEPALRRTGVTYSGDFGIEPSPDGRRVAALVRGRLLVNDLDTGRMLASVPMEGRPFVFFLEADRVRILRTVQEDEPGMPEVWRLTTLDLNLDLDIAGSRLLPVSRIELPGGRPWLWRVSWDGKRAILRQPESGEALIADLETGRTSSMPRGREQGPLFFLADGRLLLLRRDGDRHLLSLQTPDGVERLRVPLPGARFRFGSNVSPNRLVLATAERGYSQGPRDWTSWLVDLQTGRLQKIGSGMVPAFEDAATGSPPARLFFRNDDGLVLFDPETGRFRAILPGKPVEPGFWFARDRATRLPQR